jgi:hypothetical protein
MKKLNSIHVAYICPRTMKNCQSQNRSVSFKCQGGSSNNLCRENDECNPNGGLTNACCQQEIIITLLVIFI